MSGNYQDVAIVLDGDDGPPEPEPVQTDPFEERINILKREKDRRSKGSSKPPLLRPQSGGKQPQNSTAIVDATSSLKIHTADKWQSLGKKAVLEASEDRKKESSF